MAVVKTVCGDCGGSLSPKDAFCPHCGAKIERDAPVQPPPGDRKCDACGFVNTGSQPYCEACGARLTGAPPAARAESVQRRERGRKQPQPGRKKRFEPWQVVSVVALVALVGYLVYTESTRDRPSTTITAPPAGSAQKTPPPPPLEPLEKAVEANPRDPGALVRLANGLQDNGLYPRAITVYKKYLDISPKDPNARVDMGICYYQIALADSTHAGENYAAAVKEMQTAFADNPTHQPAAFNLGIVYLHMNNLEESNTWLRRAYELNKSSDLGIRAQKILQEHTIPQ